MPEVNIQNIILNFKNIRIRLAWILEIIYLVLFGIVVLYLFLQKTTFEIPWDAFMRTEDDVLRQWCRWLLEPPYYLLGYVAILRCVIQKEYNWKRIISAVLILLCGRYIWAQNGNFKIILLTFLIVGVQGISFRKLIKEYFFLISTALIVTIICAISGITENYILMRGEHMRMFFGINSPTNFASFIFFQILCWWYLRKDKLTYIEAGITTAISVFLYIFCHTRTACALLTLVSVCMVWTRFQTQKAKKKNGHYQMNSVLASLCALMHPVFAIIIIVFTISYTATLHLYSTVNGWLSGRLALGKTAFEVYGISWFGQYVPVYGFSDGQAVDNYFYIDSTYVQMPIMFGVVAMILLLSGCLYISCRALRDKDWILLLIFVLIGMHCITDPHLIELQFCPFLLALLADMGKPDGLGMRDIFRRIRWKKESPV